ncbi:hypothetical protein PYW07_010716 [Mythimna separata]|uniref:DUF229 domain containing protein n=1 Tax=Mythimna separata TaxID=271217 RepID=A0AAD7Y7K9_MYTSE|nr:hypothetical protein PYW07_010716 [Mythimna separata]
MLVTAKRWFRSRRSQYIIFTISIICIVNYIYLNNSLYLKPAVETTTMSYIDRRIEEALKEEKGSGCEIPQLNPFAEEMMQFEKTYPPLTCKGKDWVKCYLSECRVDDEILRTTTDIECTYQDIIHVSDNKYYLGEHRTVKGNKPYILDASDHVKVRCRGILYESVYVSKWMGYAIGFRKSVSRLHPPPGREDTLNVLIFGFDSTSKNGFIRNMPKSYKHLKDHVKATILNGYNIVGDGTPAALFPILTGKTELELPEMRKTLNNATLDSMPFIFYKLAKDGYRTAYFEDMPNVGTFQYRFNGFLRQPADHYLRSFYLEVASIREQDYCVGDTPQFQLMMNITDQFMRLDGKRFGFTFIADITHDGSMISVADDAMVELLQTLEQRNVFEDTLLIVMGDHGPRFTKIRDSLQGKLEERLPLMSIRLPEKFKRMRPNVQAQLEANAEILTTPHDIHATILDVLDWSQYMNPFKIKGADLPRAMTLLEPIPKNRSCSEAGIEPHWCACVNWKNVTDTEMINKSADAFINFINKLTINERSKCLPRSLTKIQWVMKQMPNSKMLAFLSSDKDGYIGNFGAHTKIPQQNYQIKVIVGPGRAIYEASMTYLRNVDKFVIHNRDISRTNAYGKEPSCISATHPHLNPYCYCSDYVSKRWRV